MAQITINEGLAWLKALKKRHEELLALCNDNVANGASTAPLQTKKSSKSRCTT
jgi:hypothetical protein